MSKLTFSIITVVKNAELLLPVTLNSVLCQTYKNFEFILVDGGSTDSTVHVARKIMSSSEINFKMKSEPDLGIYDAMNKGVRMASGNYIVFINAGDELYSAETLRVVSEITSKKPSITVFYGDSVVRFKNFERVLRAGSLENIKFGMQFSHQSTYVKSELLQKFPFDLNYRIAADYDFLLRIYKIGFDFFYIRIPLAITLSGGVSDLNRFNTYKEYLSIINKREINLIPSLFVFLKITSNFFKKPVKKISNILKNE